jgi:hypothetical protein
MLLALQITKDKKMILMQVLNFCFSKLIFFFQVVASWEPRQAAGKIGVGRHVKHP